MTKGKKLIKNVVLYTDCSDDPIQFSLLRAEIGDDKILADILCGSFDGAVPRLLTTNEILEKLLRAPLTAEDQKSWFKLLQEKNRIGLVERISQALQSTLAGSCASPRRFAYSEDFALCLQALFYIILSSWHLEHQSSHITGIDKMTINTSQIPVIPVGQLSETFCETFCESVAANTEHLSVHEFRQIDLYVMSKLPAIYIFWSIMMTFVPYDKNINVYLLVASFVEGRGTHHQTGGLLGQGVAAKLYRLLLLRMAGKELHGEATQVAYLDRLLYFVPRVAPKVALESDDTIDFSESITPSLSVAVMSNDSNELCDAIYNSRDNHARKEMFDFPSRKRPRRSVSRASACGDGL